MGGTLEVEIEQHPLGSGKEKRVNQQVTQPFSSSLYKTHHNLRGFFGYYLSDFVTIREEEHRTASA